MIVNSDEPVISTPCSSVFLPFSSRLKYCFGFPQCFWNRWGFLRLVTLKKTEIPSGRLVFWEGAAPQAGSVTVEGNLYFRLTWLLCGTRILELSFFFSVNLA